MTIYNFVCSHKFDYNQNNAHTHTQISVWVLDIRKRSVLGISGMDVIYLQQNVNSAEKNFQMVVRERGKYWYLFKNRHSSASEEITTNVHMATATTVFGSSHLLMK